MRYAHALPKAKFIGSRNEGILALSAGKTVLHLGFVDEGLLDERLRHGDWLHEQLARVARRVVGIDVSAEGVARARDLGYSECYVGDVERLSEVPFPRDGYDLILAPDIVEHLANPGLFLKELAKVLGNDTAVVLTTPSALSLKSLFYPVVGIEAVHPDHNMYYSPTTLSTLLRKCGFQTTGIWLYSQIWWPNLQNSRTTRDLLLKSLYTPLDVALRYSVIPLFPYFSDGMMIHAKKCDRFSPAPEGPASNRSCWNSATMPEAPASI
jgi:hypothetical protein